MKIQKPILELQKLGRMPDENGTSNAAELSGKYDMLLEDVELPLNYAEAEILVQLFPENNLHEVEWGLLHLFETIYEQITETEYLQLIEKCPSKEWCEVLTLRNSNANSES